MTVAAVAHNWVAFGCILTGAVLVIVGLIAIIEALVEWWSGESVDEYRARRHIESEMLSHQVRMDANNVRRQIDDELRQ